MLYIQGLISVLIGIALGILVPDQAVRLKPLGDGFVKLIKMMIAPIIFCTVVHGIASVGDLRRLGRIGSKTLVYFEVVSTVALVVGLAVVNLLQPGKGITPPGESFRTNETAVQATSQQILQSESISTTEFLLDIIPKSYMGAFVEGDLLQVLLVSVLTATALTAMGEKAFPLIALVEQIGAVFFQIMQLCVKVAPIGALGAMAFTVGAYGVGALGQLLAWMLAYYLAAVIFMGLVLGSICWYRGFSLFRLLVHIKDNILLVIGTSSSESAMPAPVAPNIVKMFCGRQQITD